MAIDYTTIENDLLISIRNDMRTDSALLVLLNITAPNAHNYIFSDRPANQQSSFQNPRIIIDSADYNPNNIGNNREGFHKDTFDFQISVWVDENPVQNVKNIISRLRILFDRKQYTAVQGGNIELDVTRTNQIVDPDKEGTRMGNVLITANILQKVI